VILLLSFHSFPRARRARDARAPRPRPRSRARGPPRSSPTPKRRLLSPLLDLRESPGWSSTRGDLVRREYDERSEKGEGTQGPPEARTSIAPDEDDVSDPLDDLDREQGIGPYRTGRAPV
jgi:hypothetical protein